MSGFDTLPALFFLLALASTLFYFLRAAKLRYQLEQQDLLRTMLESRILAQEQQLQDKEQILRDLSAQLAGAQGRLSLEQTQSEQKLLLLQEARESLALQFKALANELFDEKSRRFNELSQSSLGQLLEPLKIRLHEFQGKVESLYVQEGKDRSALAQQVLQLMELNQNLTQEARDLTSALKGSSKIQGNWGELVLERVLEGSGLRRDHEYQVQVSQLRPDGSRAQPDVVLHLPQDRHLVIDAKMSLVAYEQCVNATDPAQQELALRRHLDSVHGHIKELSERRYQELYGLKSLDFVLMFIPLEPAFVLAVSHDQALFMQAWEKNVLLVSPSTLLFVLRTVAHLWRQESQNRNAQEIASRGAELYDKLVGFVSSLDEVGQRLTQAQRSFDAARQRLAGGRGNLIRQAEMLKQMGIHPSKTLPQDWVEQAQAPELE